MHINVLRATAQVKRVRGRGTIEYSSNKEYPNEVRSRRPARAVRACARAAGIRAVNDLRARARSRDAARSSQLALIPPHRDYLAIRSISFS